MAEIDTDDFVKNYELRVRDRRTGAEGWVNIGDFLDGLEVVSTGQEDDKDV